MNIRQIYELKLLLQDKRLDLLKVADDFNLNIRSIRYDIETIKQYIFNNEILSEINIKKNVAYFQGNIEDIQAINKSLNKLDLYDKRLSAEERIIMIIFDLLWINDELTIEALCEKYYVSRTTINNDISVIKDWCKTNDINFQSSKGKGISIIQPKKNQRKNFSKLIRLYEVTISRTNSNYLSEEISKQWFPNINLNYISEIIQNAEEKYNYWLTDLAFEALIIHIALSIKRFHGNKSYTHGEIKQRIQSKNIEYIMSAYIINEINKKFNINLDDEEVYYVSIHIGSKASSTVFEEKVNYYEEFMTQYLINIISNKLNVNLRNDEKLYFGLLQHIRASYIRYENNIIIKNPLKEEMIENYKNLYEAIKDIHCINSNLSFICKNDDEIAYIVIHFAAALERINNSHKDEYAKLILICSTGFGTAELLLSNINKYFSYEKVIILSKHKFESGVWEEYDLIISTVPVTTNKPVVYVSPILKDRDIINIRTMLHEYGLYSGRVNNNETYSNSLAIQLKKLLNQYSNVDDENILMKEIIKIADELNINKKLNMKGDGYMLSEVLKKEYIKLNVDCIDWEDSIRKAGQLLVNSGCIENSYIEEAIRNVKELGPYVVITKGVALPHANSQIGVKKTAISLMTLANPVNFGNKNNDPVKYVFMLATTDAKSHLSALSDLAEFLGESEFIECLDSQNIDSILDYINDNETK